VMILFQESAWTYHQLTFSVSFLAVPRAVFTKDICPEEPKL